MEKFQEALESNKELVDTLRFFIEDRAFKTEFLLTTILEYIINNKRANEEN